MKEWKYVLVGHHDNVGKAIEKWEKMGLRFHTYACAGNATVVLGTNHYLLFKGDLYATLFFCMIYCDTEIRLLYRATVND